jgi:hypothetical protein
LLNLNRKFVVVLVPAALILCSGCSGINASHSISPATFLLPGFGATSPEPEPLVPVEIHEADSAPEFASLN